ncbi:MAG: hypothetical protein EP305_00035 [Bacteroidetes bacterium]|nr:MAG: hypothetical protein EP305_00035 [Bacteroidota bacterium]
MKNFICLIFLLVSVQLLAQGTAGIYKVKWFVDKRLTNRFVVENSGGGMGNMGLNRLEIPENLYDSVLMEIKSIVEKELQTDAMFIYSLNGNGKQLRTNATAERVGGLPRGTKRKAMKTEYQEYYVKFKIYVGLNKTFGIGNEFASYNRLKPYVRVKMKAYGIDHRVKFRKRKRTGGFDSISSFEYNVGGVQVTNTNALPIDQVVEMVMTGLTNFENTPR